MTTKDQRIGRILNAAIWIIVFLGTLTWFTQEPQKLAAQPAPPEHATTDPRKKINDEIQSLKRESLAKSLAWLNQIDLYMWPGAGMTAEDLGAHLPLSKEGDTVVEAIMSNRRFLKVLQEISALPKNKAAPLIAKELTEALDQYKVMYEKEMADSKKRGYPLMRFTMSDNADHTPTFQGARYKVLALVQLAGNLALTEVQPAIKAVCDEALKQRNFFYNDKNPKMNAAYRCCARTEASLYNRQTLSTGLLGACLQPAQSEKLIGEIGQDLKEVVLTHYDAKATPYDVIARSGMVPPDYSKGTQMVRFIPALSDELFDKIAKAAGVMVP